MTPLGDHPAWTDSANKPPWSIGVAFDKNLFGTIGRIFMDEVFRS